MDKLERLEMTSQEKRTQAAYLLLEYEEAENDLAHQRERGERMIALLNDITRWLQKKIKFVGEYSEPENIDDPKYLEVANVDNIRRHSR